MQVIEKGLRPPYGESRDDEDALTMERVVNNSLQRTLRINLWIIL